MSRYTDLEQMLVIVAQALGDELLQQVVFVGGCTTGLLITDKATLESVRYTDDVDLITRVIGYSHGIPCTSQDSGSVARNDGFPFLSRHSWPKTAAL